MTVPHFRLNLAIAVALLVSLLASTGNAQTWDLAALRSFSSLTADQWKAAAQGGIQAKILDTQHKREVAVVGLARLRAATACFVTQVQDIENFKKSPAVVKIRKFAPPVGPQDFEGFGIEARDLPDLPHCQLGNCMVKLPAGAMKRLDGEVDWSRPDHARVAQSIFREELLAYVNTYLNQGNAGLIEYQDKSDPVPLAREFHGVLSARPGLADLVPQFYEHMVQYPAQPLPGVGEFFYWSTESFGLKPVTSITHVSIYAQPGQAVIASKQIYASHYFDASLGLTMALDDTSEAAHPGLYLVYFNRSRTDALGGFFGGLRRAILRGRLREGMQKNLAEVVKKVESACPGNPQGFR